MTTCAPRRSPPLLRVLRPLSLAAMALVLSLAGCATAPHPIDTVEPPPQITQVEATAPTPPSTAEQGAQDAVGQPEDPLQPGKTVRMDDAQADEDLWARIRSAYSMPDLEDDLVVKHESWYANRPDYFERMTGRGSMYLYHIVEELQRRRMPSELALLPFIESAFNPKAMSSAKASGMWQFMPATGRDFSLKQNMFRDDRRDVLASTNAALDYLHRLHGMFGSWHLALAAYNWGEGNVSRAIARNTAEGLPTDYLSLRMPAETRNYVPKLQAMKNLVSKPAEYGLSLPPLKNHPYFVSVPIERDIDVALAARLAGLSSEEFKDLNPQMNKPVIMAAGTPQLLLPYDNADRFIANLGSYRGALASWTAWTAPRTMKLAEVASTVGMSESALRDLNHVPPRMMVRAGSTLLVTRSETRSRDVPVHVADHAHMALTPEPPPFKRVYIEARKGDTLASLARRYGFSANQLAQWNRLSSKSRLKRGQDLAIVIRSDAPDPVEVMPDPPARKNRATAQDDDDRKSVKSRKLAAKDDEDHADDRKSRKSASKSSARDEDDRDDRKSAKSRKLAAKDEDRADDRKSRKSSSKSSARDEDDRDDRKSAKSRKLAAKDEDRADDRKSRKSASKSSARDEDDRDDRKSAKSRKLAAKDDEDRTDDRKSRKSSSKSSARDEDDRDDRKSAKSRKLAAKDDEDRKPGSKSKVKADDDKRGGKSGKDVADKASAKHAKASAKM